MQVNGRRVLLWSVFLVALAVRLIWNMVIHPPHEYLYSDMFWYDERATVALREGWVPDPSFVLFPYGTHYLLVAIKFIFGSTYYTAVAVVLAVLGAVVPVLTYLIAVRLTIRKWLPILAAAFVVIYYPLISLGGYVMSEIPFCVGLLLTTYFLLRLIDQGQSRDAYLGGVAAAIAVAIRPQLLLFLLLWIPVWFSYRSLWPRVRWPLLLKWAIPIVVVLIFSSARFYYHTHEFGGVSANGSLNMMFGRCHPVSIAAIGPARNDGFGLPEFAALKNAEIATPPPFLFLAPAIPVPEVITYEGSIGDAAIHRRYIAYCIKRTGFIGQAYYSLTHTVLLWAYNIPWPDQGVEAWRATAQLWQRGAALFLCLPALLSLVLLVRPRWNPKLLVVILQYATLLLTSIIYFGGPRLRNPYDPLLIIIALLFYSEVHRKLHAGPGVGRWLARWRGTTQSTNVPK